MDRGVQWLIYSPRQSLEAGMPIPPHFTGKENEFGQGT